ncbi:MAG: LacI family transcriptional regulator [Candidatus Atribacteria bacterium]|nr:LacI family transcriptional regulator [Candidatus Atribacteria bacterium]
MGKKVTIKDIARELQVSTATVSRALNGKEGVNSHLQKKVIAKAQEMGYLRSFYPNLLDAKPKEIAVIFPGNDYFWEKVEQGVLDAQQLLQNFGIKLKIFRTEGHNLAQQNQLLENIFQKEKIDALALVPADLTQLDYFINAFYLRRVAVATFNVDAPLSKRLFYVGQDLNRAGRVAGKIFECLCRRREGEIVILTSNKQAPSHVGRWQGLIDFVHKKHLPLDVSRVVEVKDDEEAYRLTKDKLLEEKKLCGIFVSTAFGNLGVGRALREKGKKEIVVVGNDLSSEWVPYIKEGLIDCCIFQAPYWQGYLALVFLARFLLFKQAFSEKSFFLPVIPIFAENLDESFLHFEQEIARASFLSSQLFEKEGRLTDSQLVQAKPGF